MTERPSSITAVLKRSRCRVTSMPLAHRGAPHARRPPIRDHVKKVTGPDARLERQAGLCSEQLMLYVRKRRAKVGGALKRMAPSRGTSKQPTHTFHLMHDKILYLY